jgi:hypothetical protein
MTVTTPEIPAEVLAALRLPELDGLADARVRGAECVWGGERLTAETAIGLGEHLVKGSGTTAFPRACRKCASQRAYAKLLDHGTDCQLCKSKETAADCTVGRGLYRIARDGWR